MRDVRLTIDGVEVAAQEGMTLLPAARGAGVSVPTLCHPDEFEPFGSCRLCLVEVESRGRTSRVASCVYPVENQLVVRTRSETIDPIRKTILELYLAHAPDSPRLKALAGVYGADRDRFEKETSFCIHCGLCVGYCAEVKKKNAVGFVDRGRGKKSPSFPRSRPSSAGTARSASPCAPPRRFRRPMSSWRP